MDLPPWVGQTFTLSLTLSYWRQLGLAFLLGAFAVATWSDLKRRSAQREFLEIWLAFVGGMVAIDIYDSRVGETVAWQVLAVKWGLIVLFSLLSLARLRLRYGLLRLAPADVAALAAAASLLMPTLIILFYLGATLLGMLIVPLLNRRPYYPFMPVVSLATLP